MTDDVVLLHGFASTHRAYDAVIDELAPERYRALALDLPGHGVHGHQRPLTFAGCTHHVLAHSPERFMLCGYSLGARIALNVALAASDRVAALVLVSGTAGIEGEAQRAERRGTDELWAKILEQEPMQSFVDRWRAQPLFGDEPEHVNRLAVADHLRNEPAALAAVLRGLGTGTMTPMWSRLCELRMPVELLAGRGDQKYTVLGARLASALPDAQLTVTDGGHGLLLENPAAVAAAIERVNARTRRTTPLRD